MDISSKTALELYFADNFDTVLFPLLADYYIQEKDYERAEKVCQIGLEHHPDSVDGLYMAAQTALAQGNDGDAEQFLKKLQQTGVDHYEGLRLLAGIQKHMQRSVNTQAATWKKILKISPKNKSARAFLASLKNETNTEKPKEVPEKETPIKALEKEPVVSISVSDRLTTFTMVAVLNDQGLYHQALDMLDILEKKGKDPKRIERERQKIREYLKGLNEEI